MNQCISIKLAAQLSNLMPSTIRYYEREGLIDSIARNDNGVRQFLQSDITWICFLAKLRQMEMPIIQMKLYAKLRQQGEATLGARKELLLQHKQLLAKKIASLQENIVLLEQKIKTYQEMEQQHAGQNKI